MSSSEVLRDQLTPIAEAFCLAGPVRSITALGSGNVNTTYLVDAGGAFTVLQKLNQAVFSEPQLVMANLETLSSHVHQRLKHERAAAADGFLHDRRWEHPQLIRTREGGASWTSCSSGGFWRMLSFVGGSSSIDLVDDRSQASELGWGLGIFHQLISDLPVDALADTLEGFHITPRYLSAYHRALVRTNVSKSALTEECLAFIREREAIVAVLEDAKASGLLPLRPIHGDPKINNMLLDSSSGEAIALIDLDTVKPGLVHYDIGDALRSSCNRQGEESTAFDQVCFDLDLAEAMLSRYLSVARSFLSPVEIHMIPDAVRLISFELGLRFFTDHLNGNVYFRADHPDHNLQRAIVQFRLTASIEAQEQALRHLVEQLAAAPSQPQLG